MRKQLLSACNLSELLENEKLIMKYIRSSIAQSFNDQLTLAVNVKSNILFVISIIPYWFLRRGETGELILLLLIWTVIFSRNTAPWNKNYFLI